MPRRENTRDPTMSPLSLRRKYLPRNGGPQAAHPAPAAAATKAQAQPHQAPNGLKTSTKNSTTSDRHRLTCFKPGFEQDTETELAQAFKRPVRKFKEDPPFYPWLPTAPIVNFHLRFKD